MVRPGPNNRAYSGDTRGLRGHKSNVFAVIHVPVPRPLRRLTCAADHKKDGYPRRCDLSHSHGGLPAQRYVCGTLNNHPEGWSPIRRTRRGIAVIATRSGPFFRPVMAPRLICRPGKTGSQLEIMFRAMIRSARNRSATSPSPMTLPSRWYLSADKSKYAIRSPH
jgi:hypothetical protein